MKKYLQFPYFFALILFIRILTYSWVTDDAFISFRSVINFVTGNGPVFNIGERVQVFTCPLWFFFLSFGAYLDLNLYFFSILLGLLFSFLSIVLIFKLNKKINFANNKDNFSLLLIFVTLVCSETFVSFSTSGLENSLSFFLILASISILVFKLNRLFFYLSISLALLNRLDLIFILSPLFCYVLYKDFRNSKLNSLWKLFIGFLPIIIWELFSIIYYGFLFPNTKYAKIGGRSFYENIKSGLLYFFDSMQAEWHAWLVIFLIPIIYFIYILKKKTFIFKHKDFVLALIIGVYLNIFYVIVITGGDFMRGRFFSTSIFTASILLLFINFFINYNLKRIFFLFFSLISITSAYIGSKEILLFVQSGVENERNYYKKYLALHLDPENNYYNFDWSKDARHLNDANLNILGMNGQRAYYIKKNINVIDPLGVSDAFISRCPVVKNLRSGHFERYIPLEYLSIKVDRKSVSKWRDENLQNLYDKIVIVTESNNLFTVNRFRSMFWLWRHYGI
jgi:arabinofuranosyltransferase